MYWITKKRNLVVRKKKSYQNNQSLYRISNNFKWNKKSKIAGHHNLQSPSHRLVHVFRHIFCLTFNYTRTSSPRKYGTGYIVGSFCSFVYGILSFVFFVLSIMCWMEL